MEWICSRCGYITEGEEAPEKCPVCKAPSEEFHSPDEDDEPAGNEPRQPSGFRVCSICGYMSKGEEAPERCPICKAPAKAFE